MTTTHASVAERVKSLPQTAIAVLKGVPIWAWPVPLVLGIAIFLMSKSPLGWMTEKPVQEIVAPVVIGMTAALVLAVHRWVGARFSLMLACFVWSLFFRELHFWGTNNGFYIAFVVLAIWGWWQWDSIAEFLAFKCMRGLLSSALLVYFLSKIFDRGYLSFLPHFQSWQHNLEETLESCGHVLVFSLVVMTLRIATMPRVERSR